MEKITFLGPVGATFSHDAYNILAEKYDAPAVIAENAHIHDSPLTNCMPADANADVLALIIKHGGYGAIAMETLAKGRVAEPVEAFIALLQTYSKIADCPLRVVGAIHMKLHFCLMARAELSKSDITEIIAHPKAFDPCKENVRSLNIPVVEVSSNGKAAELVASDDKYATAAALGPKSAAEKFGLQILDPEFEDQEAVTTFFLIAPAKHTIALGKDNRALIVFKVSHEPGSLVKALSPFAEENLNLIQIHSVHIGNHTYSFAIELEVRTDKLDAFSKALNIFERHVDAHLVFGPFEVFEG